MRTLLAIIIIIGLFTAAGYLAFRPGNPLRDQMLSNPQVVETLKKLDQLRSRITYELRRRFFFKEDEAMQKYAYGEKVAVFFKDGSVMVGELVGRTEDKYIIKWKGYETVVYAERIERIGDPKEALAKKTILTDEEITRWWPYKNDVVIRLTNNMVLDAEIARVGDEKITLLHSLEGRGHIEQDIERSKIEYLIFKPVDNEKSSKIEASLKKLFPKMEFYKVGNFTIVTDSYVTWVDEYKKTLRNTYTNVYLKFFDLFNDGRPQVQNYIVIFDDYGDYIEYAITDGVPGWAAAGYFSPSSEVLYLFNILGEKFSAILLEGIVEESGRKIDEIVEKIEENVDKRYHIFIEGQAKKITDKFWAAYSYYRNMFRESTMSTLRHEFTHEVFHNWGLQSIKLSKFEKNQDVLVKKKKQFLEAKDYKEKAELVKSLIMMKAQEAPLEMKAANSWLAEGIATYCETEWIGAQNDRWLFLYQEMARKGSTYPLEFLTVYKMGSFPGVCSEAALNLYAQSWAFVAFLTQKYPKEFMAYQKKMLEETAGGQEDINWLLQALGKDLKTLEAEFVEYMKTYERLEDPFVIHFVKLHELFKD